MSESEIIDSLVTGAVPVFNTIENVVAMPGVLPSNAINSTSLAVELPYAANSFNMPTVKSTSFSDSTISFNHTVSPEDLVSRGICFTIDSLVMEYDVEVGLIRDDGQVPTQLSAQAKTDLASTSRTLKLNTAKIALKNFSNAIDSVVVNLGNDFNFTVSDCSVLASVLPFYSDEEDHKINPPLYKQKGFQHSAELNNDLVINAGGVDYYDSSSSSYGVYDPFSKSGSFAQRASVSTGPDVRDLMTDGIVEGKVLKGEQTGRAEIQFKNIRFSIPSDVMRENIRLDETGMYGLQTLDITIKLSHRKLKELLICPADFATKYNIARDNPLNRIKWTLDGVVYTPVYNFKEFRTLFGGTGGRATSRQVNMLLTKRTPISAIEMEMRKNGDYFLPFKEYRVTRHGLTNVMTRGSPAQRIDSRDITMHVIPSHIMFYFEKQGNICGNLGFGRINDAKISIGSRVTDFSSNVELYNMSVANGLKMTQADFSDVTGSIACLDLTSLNVGPELLIGEASNIQINISATCSRIDAGYDYADGDSDQYELVVICIYDKVAHRKNGKFTIRDGYNIGSAKSGITYDSLSVIARKPLIYGSGLFSSIWRGIKKGVSALPGIANAVSKYAPMVGSAAQAANKLLGGRKDSYIVGGASVNSDAILFK